MVIGESEEQPASSLTGGAAPPANIDNIMSGISNTGTVKMNNHRKKLRQRFDIIKKLGQGTYGKVQLGINKETGQEVAIKTIKKCKIETEADLVRIRREVQIMSSVQHPNIIHIYEVFENREKMVLVMEFAAGGELYDYLSERKVLSEDEARRVFRQISTAVYYCHKHKICHRDLKLENILLDEHGNAKIADFGLSNVFDDQRLLATFCGSPLYASPEIVKGTPYQGPEVDCWSLGVLLYTLVYGAMPFDGSNFKRLVKQISAGDYYEPKKPSPASPLIKEMLTVCPQRRATIEQICNHWWVNSGYSESCLDLAEELANQTPVRLDVLLSLTPSAITSDQLVVPGPVEDTKPADRVARSHSVGSIRDIGSTEAERRILDMVAAGGEAALAPSPTRTITPAESPAQPKRKLETTVSTDNAIGIIMKKDKIAAQCDPNDFTICEKMEIDLLPETAELIEPTEEQIIDTSPPIEIARDATIQIKDINGINEELANKLTVEPPKETSPEKKKIIKKKIVKSSATAGDGTSTATDEKKKSPTKTVRKVVSKTKSPPDTGTITLTTVEQSVADQPITSPIEKDVKNFSESKTAQQSAQPEDIKPQPERRKSRIFEAAEKFQSMSAPNNDKVKKIVIPGVSVGNFKKEFERKASLTSQTSISSTEKKLLEKRGSDSSNEQQPCDSRKSSICDTESIVTPPTEDDNKTLNAELDESATANNLNESESKSSITSFSLEEARRSMENSIALLNQAKTESNTDLDQLCQKTENVAVSDENAERLKKLKNAREIIGNAIPVGRLGIRKPPVPFGVNGRSSSGGVVPSSSSGLMNDRKPVRLQLGSDPSNLRMATAYATTPDQKIFDREPLSNVTPKPVAIGQYVEPEVTPTTKTSRAEITLKSATLPRRKTTKPNIQLDVQPKAEHPMRFQTEMQHQVPDLRSAPIHEHSVPYSPISIQQRSTSLDPQQPKEFMIPIQRPSAYNRRPSTMSRQSTNESDTDIQNAQSQSQLSTSSSGTQPIKKSPREFIIPIAVEGVGLVTPRAGSLEPSDSNYTTNSSTFSRLGRPTRRIGSLLNDRDSEEDTSSFHKMHRHTSIGRESDTDEPRFAMHRLRTTRPLKKLSQDPNDSGSSGEDDDEDGFEILTAENLFSTLLSRVRALTNRLNVNNSNVSSGFPSSRFMNNIRQTQSPFWNHDPFTSRLNNGSGAWRHSISRDLGTDIDSMFQRSGATLPRGTKNKNNNNTTNSSMLPTTTSTTTTTLSSTSSELKQPDSNDNNCSGSDQIDINESLDLGDLDLSRLRLTKQDLETLSSITPGLPKHCQDQLLAQLPPNQARKLSRTLSMQNNSTAPTKVYKRSLSSGRESSSSSVTNNQQLTGKLNDSQKEDDVFDRNTVVRRSLSKSKASRSSSRCVSSDDYNGCSGGGGGSSSLRSSYSSDIGDKYKSCHQTSNASTDSSSYTFDKSNKCDYNNTILAYKYYETLPPRASCMSPTKDYYGRPPSGCISPPPPLPIDSPVRRRSSQRNVSRFLRSDFYDTTSSSSRDDCNSAYIKDKKQREYETQVVLREIRERSRERSLDRRDKNNIDTDRSYYSNIDTKSMSDRRKSSIPNVRAPLDNSLINHIRNKSVDRCCNLSDDIFQRTSIYHKNDNDSQLLASSSPITTATNSFSNAETKTDAIDFDKNLEKSANQRCSKFTDKILDELQALSLNHCDTISTPLNDQENKMKREQKSDDQSVTKKVIVKTKKIKSKDVEDKCVAKDAEDNSIYNVKMVTSLTKEIDSVVALPKLSTNDKTTKKLSKLARPKSYPIKEIDQQQLTRKSPDKIDVIQENGTAINSEKSIGNDSSSSSNTSNSSSKTERPKSYPYSKITPPKDIGKFTTAKTIGNGSTITEKPATKQLSSTLLLKSASKSDKERSTETSSSENTVATVKKVKILKKSATTKTDSNNASNSSTTIASASKQTPPATISTANQPSSKLDDTIIVKEKSPDKKTARGFLYSIGQKFEKLREVSKGKDKKTISKLSKPVDNVEKVIDSQANIVAQQSATDTIKKSKSKTSTIIETSTKTNANDVEKSTERKSRIDTMIRHLRERSLPRGPALTESGLIKRAVSVEDMTGNGFNRCTVNKVLGLFKKIEKDHQNDSINSAPETLDTTSSSSSNGKERPKSSGFVSKLKKTRPYTGAKSDTIITLTDQIQKQLDADKFNGNLAKLNVAAVKKQSNNSSCPNCIEEKCSSNNVIVTKRHQNNDIVDVSATMDIKDKERMRNNRKGLVLDFSRFDKPINQSNNNNHHSIANNNNNNSSNVGVINNNYIQTRNTTKDQHHSITTPIYDTVTNYSSDSRSLHDDCASTSTFLSPTDEPELYFDNWSICSEDNFSGAHSTPSISRLSRNSHGTSSPMASGSTNTNYSNAESVIDRIKRKSFYCRFNDNKTAKRQYNSSAAPAAREYYREAAAKLKSRPPERLTSPSTMTNTDYNSSSTKNIDLSHSHHPHNAHVRSHSIIGTNSPSPYNNLRSSGSNDTLKSQSKSSYDDDLLKSYRPSEYLRSKTVNYNLPPPTPSSPSSSTKIHQQQHSQQQQHHYSPPTLTNDYSKYRSTDYFSLQPTNHRSSVYDTTTTPLYGTYSPKRRTSSYTVNGTSSTGSSITTSSAGLNATTTNNSYGTLGRKSRPYDHRSISMLDSSSCNNTTSGGGGGGGYSYRRDSRGTTDFGNITRPNYRMRTPSITRSPTNI